MAKCDWKKSGGIVVITKTSSALVSLGAVYMTPWRLSRRDEFTPVPSHGSTFVYMIPGATKVMPARVAPA